MIGVYVISVLSFRCCLLGADIPVQRHVGAGLVGAYHFGASQIGASKIGASQIGANHLGAIVLFKFCRNVADTVRV